MSSVKVILLAGCYVTERLDHLLSWFADSLLHLLLKLVSYKRRTNLLQYPPPFVQILWTQLISYPTTIFMLLALKIRMRLMVLYPVHQFPPMNSQLIYGNPLRFSRKETFRGALPLAASASQLWTSLVASWGSTNQDPPCLTSKI